MCGNCKNRLRARELYKSPAPRFNVVDNFRTHDLSVANENSV